MIKQNLLDQLYGSEIINYNFNLENSSFVINFKITENELQKTGRLIFDKIEKLEFNNEDSEIIFSTMLINEIYNLVESLDLNVDQYYFKNYNYLIDGDGFDFFIFSNEVLLRYDDSF